MRGAIRPRRLKAKGQLFVVGDLQAASCQRRASGVTDEAFQTGSVQPMQESSRKEITLSRYQHLKGVSDQRAAEPAAWYAHLDSQ